MRRPRCQRGIIFVTAMWVTLILGALVLLFARSMRVETTAAGNRLAAHQVSTIELGAEQYVMSAVDGCNGDAVTVLATPAEQLQLGTGYFWILQAFPTDDSTYAFGITDESSKLNLNIAGDAELALLPGMTQDVADSIVDWRDTDSNVTGQGAESDYYNALQRPYAAKNAPMESIEEIYLVKGITDEIMWGQDVNHNGVLEAEEASSGASMGFDGGADSSRGIAPFITVWGKEPNTDANGNPRVNVNPPTDPNALAAALLKAGLSRTRAAQVADQARTLAPFKSVFDFAAKVRLTPAEFQLVADTLTVSTSKTLTGLVNVNTAPSQVLMCLPGLTQSDADAIVAARGAGASTASSGTSSAGSLSSSTTTSNTGIAWVATAVTPAKAGGIGARITGRSYFYSADIVAVTGDGRGFKRVRIVLDGRSSPPVVIFRKDLTSAGWPLSPDIRDALRNGKPLPAVSGYGTGAVNGIP
ncbi:MAG TPA: type II secretion system protein GspK [Tepidisphaeraceae bacterium]|nr:type II secretion system protein GspK [Tepidisphaeraceae bacterium]